MKRRRKHTIQSNHHLTPEPDLEDHIPTPQRVLILLMVAVVTVLLALIFSGGATWWVVAGVVVVLTVLMLVVIGTPHLLPKILREIARILRL